MVARDGIEPPTPAFSGLCSTVAILLIHKQLSSLLPHTLGNILWP